MMDTNEEKRQIYEQLKLIIDERRRLSELYYEWKEKLEELNDPKNERTNSRRSQIDLRIESEYQNYMNQKKANHFNSYQDLSLTIASILKEAGTPLSNKQLLHNLVEKKGKIISSQNLTCNILPRMNKDEKIPVEKAYRGYWQYRLP